ncbi:MAG: hypothetical protein P8N67_06625 [Pseudomonadales bacterium]|nr:hypothetical protein [Pseudomonadales bacterium]
MIASLFVTLIVFGGYFYSAFTKLALNPAMPSIAELIFVVILVIVFESIMQIFIRLKNTSQSEDERDRLIEKISYKYGYWVLSACTWFLLVQLLLDATFDHLTVFSTPSGIFHLLLLFFVLAEVAHFVVQLYYYRRGF